MLIKKPSVEFHPDCYARKDDVSQDVKGTEGTRMRDFKDDTLMRIISLPDIIQSHERY